MNGHLVFYFLNIGFNLHALSACFYVFHGSLHLPPDRSRSIEFVKLSFFCHYYRILFLLRLFLLCPLSSYPTEEQTG